MARKRAIFLAVVGIVSVLFLCVFVFSGAYIASTGTLSKKKDLKRYSYNPATMKTTSSQYKRGELPKKQFFSFQSRNDRSNIYHYVTVSSSNKFTCQGVCECGEAEYRRSVGVLSKSMFFVVSAVTATLAAQIAKDYFHNSCRMKLSSECPNFDSIFSEVTECTTFEDDEDKIENSKVMDDKNVDEFWDELKHVDEEVDKIEFDREEQERREYYCDGHCLNRPNAPSPFDCSQLRVGRTVIDVICEKEMLEEGSRDMAEYEFLEDYLDDFCMGMSQPKRFPSTELFDDFVKHLPKGRENYPVCVAQDTFYKMKNWKCVFKPDDGGIDIDHENPKEMEQKIPGYPKEEVGENPELKYLKK